MHADDAGQPQRLVDVVGDEHDRSSASPAGCAASRPAARARVIGSTAANGSSISSRSGSAGQRAGDPDPLLLAARQLVRVFAAIGLGVETQQLQQLGRPGRAPAGAASPAGAARSRCCPRPANAETGRSTGSRSRCGGAAPRAATARMSSPPTRIAPESNGTSRLIMRNVVDLPQPEGPSSTQNAPSGTVSDSSSTTRRSP